MDYVSQYLGAAQIYVPAYELYIETEPRFLPVRIESDKKQYFLFGSSKQSNSKLCLSELVVFNGFSEKHSANEVVYQESFTVSDCIDLCQRVLGLKINEISKLVGVSRATLDLHRKSAVNIKNINDYKELYDFVGSLDNLYGESLKVGVRSVLINSKTLLQHFIDNRTALSNVYGIVEEVAKKISNVKSLKTDFDENKLVLRLSNIGRKA